MRSCVLVSLFDIGVSVLIRIAGALNHSQPPIKAIAGSGARVEHCVFLSTVMSPIFYRLVIKCGLDFGVFGTSLFS
jgi:hypothetical protein